MFINNLKLEYLQKLFKNYPLYSQEYIDNPRVVIEFYIPHQNIYWLITEGNIENDDFIMFGYCHITDSELGYVSFNELMKYEYIVLYKIHTNTLLDDLKIKHEN